VSLVLLPEECDGLSDRRYPWQRVKLAAIRQMLRSYAAPAADRALTG